ncbi:uncharacterized protein LOC109853287 [Pseudomyrmex gracilis]|uniref:uncharacterized protein LOC109853287 n=1 Tax=Pseudomyrmex gracilis TaxID=219809 RepID=UPI000995CC1E|nr:uncharacterized protein LOC109853287 [Pseudomyrmex gracilis]
MFAIKRISYEEEKKKNPELKDSDVQILNDWCMKQPHLPKILDVEYALFLHSNYYQIEPSKTTIEAYYTSRTHMTEFFSDRDPLGTKQLREAFKITSQVTLPKATKEGYKVVYTRLIDYDPTRFVYNDIMKYFAMVVDMWLYTEGTASGHVIIIDMEGVTFSHAGRLSPLGIKKFLYYLQEAIPIRLKGLHFINTNAVMDIILAMMKPFMKKELLNVLHIHTTPKETLPKFVSLEVFPCDISLVGKERSLKQLQEEQLKRLEDHREWFLKDEATGRVNEALRVDKSKTIDKFGVEGSFKKRYNKNTKRHTACFLPQIILLILFNHTKELIMNQTRNLQAEIPPYYVPLEEEYKRNPELKASDLQILLDWMDKQPHLPKIQMFYLVYFLHSNYYYLEATKKTIDNFFTARTHMPELFCNRDPIGWKDLRQTFSVVAIVPLKQLTKEGYVMTFAKLLDTEPTKFIQNEAIKYLFMTCETQNLMQGTNQGQIIILDAAGAKFGHVARMSNPIILKKLLFYIQEAAPVRLKAIHVLNSMSIVDTIFNMIKPLMKPELINIVHFHTNMETVKNYLPIEGLPNEYGGKAGTVNELVAKHIKLLEEFREWFKVDEDKRVNESLRVEKFEGGNDLFGVEGSFKKLEID